MRGVMKLAMVDTNTSSTAMSARITLMNLPSRARALAFSTPSNCTTCCCCCCSCSVGAGGIKAQCPAAGSLERYAKKSDHGEQQNLSGFKIH